MTLQSPPNIQTAKWSPENPTEKVTAFLRRPAFNSEAEELAREVLGEIHKKGDRALKKYIRKFDGATLTPDNWAVTADELAAARLGADRNFRIAAKEVHNRIVRFAQAGTRQDWNIPSPKGGLLAEQFTPLKRVGVYIPGGAAPLASTALMTVTLAKVAGVSEIVACTPSDKQGSVSPYILYALELAGATKIYKFGGIHAIGAMAYGTETIPKVQKIVGPGGPFVTAAKRLVYGEVDLDMVAGPSEIAILADASAHPGHVAADLLSQAEHGTGLEKSLLVSSSKQLVDSVKHELLRQTETLTRQKEICEVLNKGTLLVEVTSLDHGMDLCNRFAPEHLEILVDEPRKWLKKVQSAGAVFLGPWTPEVVGDFAAGPSHVLPTGGTARMFSGLTVDTFRKRTSVVSFTRADLQDVLALIEAFGRVEELDGHTRSAQIRFE